jgi:flagellar FliL protein
MAKKAKETDPNQEPKDEAAEEPSAPAAAKKGLVGRILGPVLALPRLLLSLNPLKILKLPMKLKLAVLGGLLILGGGIAGAVYFLSGGEEHAVADAEHGAPVTAVHLPSEHTSFFAMPDIIVNIQTPDGTPAYLKLSVALEVDQPDAHALIEPVLPRVVDQFQTYLRELRVEDIRGSAGVMRLKEELLRRVNFALAPLPVRDVLLKEMIVQ